MSDGEVVIHELINKVLEENKWKQKDLKVTPIPFVGANYTSSLYTITLTTETDVLDMFAKVGNVAGEMRTEMDADWIYQTERVVYTKLFKVYEALQDKHNLLKEHRLVFPKCYGFETESGRETVLMENLASKGYKEWNRFDSMSWEHASLSVELLAKFHALSLAFAKERPKEFEELASNMVYKAVSIDRKNPKVDGMWRLMCERALKVLSLEHRTKLRPVLFEENFMYQFHKPIGKPVLVHGDYRLNNIMFRRKGRTLEGIPVDFQLVHAGCVAEDLLFLIFLGSDEEFRKQHYHKLLDHYYEHLCQALQRLDVDPVTTYPRETFDEHMKKMLRYVLFLCVFFLPLLTVETANAPRLSDDGDVAAMVLEPSPLYAVRLQGIVKDLDELGAI